MTDADEREAMKRRASVLSAMLVGLAFQSTPDPARRFLFDHGWVPFGSNCSTGLEGWGKMIDGKPVVVDQPEALALEGYDPR